MSNAILTMVISSIFATGVFAQTEPSVVIAPEIVYIDPLETLDNKDEYLEWLTLEAGKHSVSASLMTCLINHENKSWVPSMQSGYYKNGIREDSWGLAQIHLPSHPEITKEQAQDAKFSISWMASEIKQGRAWQWTTLKYCK
jgi:hypothetical protein